MGDLGQVFTSDKIASLMAQILLEKNYPLKTKILDPCIGPNVFLKHVNKVMPSAQLFGVEIDKSLVGESTTQFYKAPNATLAIGNFFDFADTTQEKFDLIIENPPYVRQEKMAEANNKDRIREIFKNRSYKIPAKSNLYIYFLLRSIDLLNDGGRLVAVVYDSWLYSQYGETFKRILSSLGSIDSIIHFKDGAFDDASIGATIIEFTKGVKQAQLIRFSTFENAAQVTDLDGITWIKKSYTDLADEDNKLVSHDSRYVHLGSVASINRGTSALNNKLFVFKEKQFEETIPFLKNIKDIDGMSAKQDKHLLVVRDKYRLETQNYLEKIKNIILDNTSAYQTLSKRVNTEELWYTPRLAKPGDIIFNYYLRDSFDFILNEKRLQSSDNFYNLRFENNIFAHFALLNSSIAKKAILDKARTQGSGLKKVQIYEFKQVLIPNITLFKISTIDNLEVLGKKLARQNRSSAAKTRIINLIDTTIDSELLDIREKRSVDYTRIQYGQTLV